MPYVEIDGTIHRLSQIEADRYNRGRARREGVDDRFEPRHPNRQDNSRRAMRNLVRWRTRRATGHFSDASS